MIIYIHDRFSTWRWKLGLMHTRSNAHTHTHFRLMHMLSRCFHWPQSPHFHPLILKLEPVVLARAGASYLTAALLAQRPSGTHSARSKPAYTIYNDIYWKPWSLTSWQEKQGWHVKEKRIEMKYKTDELMLRQSETAKTQSNYKKHTT